MPTFMREIGLPPEPVPPNKKPKNAATTIGVSTLTTRARRSRKKYLRCPCEPEPEMQ